MRILHLGKYYSPVKGGIESTSKYIVDYLSDYEHCVLCFNALLSKEIFSDMI